MTGELRINFRNSFLLLVKIHETYCEIAFAEEKPIRGTQKDRRQEDMLSCYVVAATTGLPSKISAEAAIDESLS
jgi:hypothetical protein